MSLRKQSLLVCSLVGLLLLASSHVNAQRPEGRGRRGMGRGEMSGLMLLGQKSVQDELKLSEQQVADAGKALEAQRTAMQNIFSSGESERAGLFEKARGEADQVVAKILSADQAKRLGQIRLQVRGVGALADDETTKALALSDEQKKAVAKINEDLGSEIRATFQNRGGNREENRKKMTELNKSAKEKAEAVLTAEQKTKWTELTGAPFTGELTFGGGRGGVGGGRGDGNRAGRRGRPQTE